MLTVLEIMGKCLVGIFALCCLTVISGLILDLLGFYKRMDNFDKDWSDNQEKEEKK